MRRWGRAGTAVGIGTVMFVLVACGRNDASNGGAETGAGPEPGQRSVAIEPTTAVLAPSESLQFSATVTGAAAAGLTWSVNEGDAGGTVTADGLYTAPGIPGTYHVLVALVDEADGALAAVTVMGPGARDSGGASPEPGAPPAESGRFERVSVGASGAEADGLSLNPSASADGRFVAFISEANNLVPGDTNGLPDVFIAPIP